MWNNAIEITATFTHCGEEWTAAGQFSDGFFTPHDPERALCPTCGKRASYFIEDAPLPTCNPTNGGSHG